MLQTFFRRRILLLELHGRDQRVDRRYARLDKSICTVLTVLENVYVDCVQCVDAVDVDWTGLPVAAHAADCLRHG